MKKYYTLEKNGFISYRHFDYKHDAEFACEVMNMLEDTDQWKVKEILYS